MRKGLNRRSAMLGMGAAAALASFKGCGGGGSPAAGVTESAGLPGSIWYVSGDSVVKVPGGVGQRQFVAKTITGNTSRPQISRLSPRYLQTVYSDDISLLQCYDHSSNQPYCFLRVPGFVGRALVSPSGNFIAMQRSPTLANAAIAGAAQGVEYIIGLNIADISDPNAPKLIRGEFNSGLSSVFDFDWIGDIDRLMYVTLERGIFSASATAGTAGDERIGRLNDQGKLLSRLDVHPDGSLILVTLAEGDRSGDIYLYKSSGELLDKVTDTGQGGDPIWSPDAKHFMFTYGYTGICDDPCSFATCETYFAPSDARNVTQSTARLLDRTIVPCVGIERFWSSIA
jgi:hypothetical protein